MRDGISRVLLTVVLVLSVAGCSGSSSTMNAAASFTGQLVSGDGYSLQVPSGYGAGPHSDVGVFGDFSMDSWSAGTGTISVTVYPDAGSLSGALTATVTGWAAPAPEQTPVTLHAGHAYRLSRTLNGTIQMGYVLYGGGRGYAFAVSGLPESEADGIAQTISLGP